jgi:hypothetical protein
MWFFIVIESLIFNLYVFQERYMGSFLSWFALRRSTTSMTDNHFDIHSWCSVEHHIVDLMHIYSFLMFAMNSECVLEFIVSFAVDIDFIWMLLLKRNSLRISTLLSVFAACICLALGCTCNLEHMEKTWARLVTHSWGPSLVRLCFFAYTFSHFIYLFPFFSLDSLEVYVKHYIQKRLKCMYTTDLGRSILLKWISFIEKK